MGSLYNMVLSNAPARVRNIQSLTNKPTGGGNKKGGLAPSVGLWLTSNPNLIGATNTQFGLISMGNYSNPSQSALRAIRRY